MTSPDEKALISGWPTSLAAWERAKLSLGGGVSTGLRATMPPHPLFFTHGAGSQVWDVDGHRYTDYVLGWGPTLLGHSHPEVRDAVVAQVSKAFTFGSGHHFEYEAAELLLQFLPWAQRVLWSNTGTEANLSALRLSRAFTGRQRIVKCSGHYHGWHDQVLVNYRGDGADGVGNTVPGSRGQSMKALEDITVARFGDLPGMAAILRDPAADIACVLVEPVLNNSGVLLPPPGYLEGLRALCDETGTMLVFDDVICGFRLAPGGSAEYFGVQPDLVILAKGIAAGFTVAAVAGRADVIDGVNAGVVHAGTYNGNPVVLAATHAALTVLKREQPWSAMAARAGRLADGLGAAMLAAGVAGHAHHVGPVVQVALGITSMSSFSDYLSADWKRFDEFIVAMLRRGEFLMPGGRMYLSTAHDDEDIDRTIARARDALAELAGSTGKG